MHLLASCRHDGVVEHVFAPYMHGQLIVFHHSAGRAEPATLGLKNIEKMRHNGQ